MCVLINQTMKTSNDFDKIEFRIADWNTTNKTQKLTDEPLEVSSDVVYSWYKITTRETVFFLFFFFGKLKDN